MNLDFDYIDTHFPQIKTPRPIDSHKGMFGTLAVIGGGQGMAGAALLAARAALKLGAGRVHIGFTQEQSPLSVDILQPELMLDTAHSVLSRSDITVWLAGCGMGLGIHAIGLLRTLCERHDTHPLVLDADALTILSQNMLLMPNQARTCVLTPHPGEAARLLNVDTADIQRDREQSAIKLAKKYQAWILLKGHESIICSPDLQLLKNPTGHSGLSTAGTGDVLAGMIASLLGQGLVIGQAVKAAVYLHGYAAQALLDKGVGPIGLTASEIIDSARFIRNALIVKT